MAADNMALLTHQVKALDLKVPESSKDQQKQQIGSIAHIRLPIIRIWQFNPFEIPNPLQNAEEQINRVHKVIAHFQKKVQNSRLLTLAKFLNRPDSQEPLCLKLSQVKQN